MSHVHHPPERGCTLAQGEAVLLRLLHRQVRQGSQETNIHHPRLCVRRGDVRHDVREVRRYDVREVCRHCCREVQEIRDDLHRHLHHLQDVPRHRDVRVRQDVQGQDSARAQPHDAVEQCNMKADHAKFSRLRAEIDVWSQR